MLFVSFETVATGHLTNIKSGVNLYSEYYSNNSTQFKGTIIFENGSGTDLSEWKMNPEFFTCIKKSGALFLYDRSGLGKSPPDFNLSPDNPITGELISDKLSLLLKKNKIKPPYIFVSHSYGAIYTSYFVLKNPNLVKGVILVDPVPRNFHFSINLMSKYNLGIGEAKKCSSLYIYKKYGGSIAEVIYQLIGFNQSIQTLKALGNISYKIPVVIISSTGMDKEHPLQEGWYESQKQWLNDNSSSKALRVSSGHFIQLEEPQIICNEITEIVNR